MPQRAATPAAALEPEPVLRVASASVSDLDELSERTVDFDADYVQLAPGPVRIRMLRVGLDHMVLLRSEDQVPSINLHAGLPEGMTTFGFVVGPGRHTWQGRPVGPHALARYAPGAEHVGAASGRNVWVCAFLETSFLDASAAALRGAPPDIGSPRMLIEPAPERMQALQCAVQHAFAIAESAPQALAEPQLRRAVEQSVVAACVQASDDPIAPRSEDGAETSDERVVRRAEEMLEARPEEPIYLAELCAATGVSERTVHNAFQRIYGVSPMRYLHRRRMTQVRRALRAGDPERDRVAAIAQRFGFANLGRFAVEFRQLFGASPSQELRGRSRR